MKKKIYFICLFWLSPLCANEALRSHLDYTTTISRAYDARSVFINPAALGYQTELNGSGLLSTFAFSFNAERRNEFNLGLSYGYFGLGLEHLASGNDLFNRFSFALGMPLSRMLYLGTRFSFTAADNEALDGFYSLDLGLQFRPSDYFSIGFLVDSVTEPDFNGSNTPAIYKFGLNVRPLRNINLSFDIDTPSNDFAGTFDFEANAHLEIIEGLVLSAGYHDEHKVQFGIQLNLERTSIFSSARPDTPDRTFVVGNSLSVRPKRSFLKFNKALTIKLDSSISEKPVDGGLLGTDRPALLSYLRALEQAKNNPSIKIVFLYLDSFPLGLAAASDVADALWELRDAGKRIEIFLDSAGIKKYLIASAAHKIYMAPAGELRFTGLKSERYYLKGTLDKIGVEGEFLAKGKYKSAPETFTRKQASKISREETLNRLRLAEKALLYQLNRGRKITPSKWNEMQKHVLYSAQEAKEAGLVDTLMTFQKGKESIQEAFLTTSNPRLHQDRLALPSRVAVIVAQGDILKQKMSLLSITGNTQTTPTQMRRLFKGALNDPATKAIVLRVNSPGGTIVPSAEIAEMVASARKQKPVVVSMGDVAASGGYMISAPANKIFAQPLSLTGSIGVFLGKVNMEKLFEKIDLHKEVLSLAPYADLHSEHRPMTAKTRAIFTRRLNAYYDDFVYFVSANRKLSQKEAETAAQGRVWLGDEAKRYRLIDQTGSYLEAIRHAASLAGLSPKDYEIGILTAKRGLFDLFGDDSPLIKSPPTLGWVSHLAKPALIALELKESPFLYWSPHRPLEDH